MNKELLQRVIQTLNNIDVRGKSNLDRLLGCINALEAMMQTTEDKGEQSNG